MSVSVFTGNPGLGLGVTLQQFDRRRGLVLGPLHQTIDRRLVELARLVAQAVHALLDPVLLGHAHGVLQLGHLATEQGLAQQQQGLGAFACAPVR